MKYAAGAAGLPSPSIVKIFLTWLGMPLRNHARLRTFKVGCVLVGALLESQSGWQSDLNCTTS